LYLKPSSIPNSGSGLFTSKDIATKTRIAKYTGVIKTLSESQANPTGYDVAIPKGRVLDASSTQSGIARYANDCRTVNKKKKQCKGNNAKFSISTRKGVTSVWLVSTKAISAGSEIFVSYGGSAYWRR
jgi:SET domain-containing protein